MDNRSFVFWFAILLTGILFVWCLTLATFGAFGLLNPNEYITPVITGSAVAFTVMICIAGLLSMATGAGGAY